MAKSLSYAADKWARKTANAGSKWKAAVDSGAAQRYCEGLASFLQHPAPQACAAYASGVAATSASDFQTSIAGGGSKYTASLQRVA